MRSFHSQTIPPAAPLEPAASYRSKRVGAVAFTLVEMLAVMGIIVILLGIIVPIVSHRSDSVGTSVYDIQGALEMARTYAVANHTYAWVGFFEEDVSTASTKPATSGVGRLVIVTVASRDGTSINDPAVVVASQGTVTPLLPSNRLLLVGKVIKLENIHMFIPASSNDSFGQRPGNYLPSNADRVGLNDGQPLLFQFQYPLGGTVQYTLGIRPAPQAHGIAAPSAVVQFNPQGEMISDAGPLPGVAPCQEIAIEATHGNVPATDANVGAIDLSGLTGAATIYRR